MSSEWRVTSDMNVESRKSKVEGQSPKAVGGGPLLILISAPSGGGKTTFVPAVARRPVGHDTRHHLHDPRAATRRKERCGLLFFWTAGFERRVQAGEFIEHATVFGRSYGILRSELLDKLRCGRDVLLNVDVQGAATIRDRALADPELKRALVTVFLTPPSITVLEERLKKRASDAPEEIQSGWASRGRNRAVEKF